MLANANSVLIHNNRLWWLNPIAGKYTDGSVNSSVTLWSRRGRRGRSLEIVQRLRQLSSMHRLPDAVFQLSFGDVPSDVPNGGLPTLSIHGWVGTSVPILRYPQRHPSDSEIAAAKPIPWAAKSRRLVYSDGHAWKSAMPSDPFRVGRAKVRQLARDHPADIYLPTKPNSTQLKSIPYKEWRTYKYVLYVDGIAAWSRCRLLVPPPARTDRLRRTVYGLSGLLHAFWRRALTAQTPVAAHGAVISACQSRRFHCLLTIQASALVIGFRSYCR